MFFQEKSMADVKKIDCAPFPPRARTLYKKVQRAHFVSIIWGNADLPYPGNGLDNNNNNNKFWTKSCTGGHKAIQHPIIK